MTDLRAFWDDRFFLETHPNPAKALSDGSNMLKLEKLANLLNVLIKINTIKNKI